MSDEPVQVVMLSREGEIELLNDNKRLTDSQIVHREYDHQCWNNREERFLKAKMENTSLHNRHISEVNWHNRVTTVLFLVITVFVIKVLTEI